MLPHPSPQATPAPTHAAALVDVAQELPEVLIDLRYAGNRNFMGRPAQGYARPLCLLSRPALRQLRQVARMARTMGLALKIYDAYRPQRAVDDFVRWSKDPGDQRMKASHYPQVDKHDLFALGYIAARSAHSRGSAVDLSLVAVDQSGVNGRSLAAAEPFSRARLAAAPELDMGSAFDLFDPVSHTRSTGISKLCQFNRALLQDLMAAAGFEGIAQEWWHFQLNNEPYPSTYFDDPLV